MMATIVPATVQAYIDAGQNGHTTAEQGRALEDLICYVMGQIPGVAITHRNELNAFDTEEIDVRFGMTVLLMGSSSCRT